MPRMIPGFIPGTIPGIAQSSMGNPLQNPGRSNQPAPQAAPTAQTQRRPTYSTALPPMQTAASVGNSGREFTSGELSAMFERKKLEEQAGTIPTVEPPRNPHYSKWEQSEETEAMRAGLAAGPLPQPTNIGASGHETPRAQPGSGMSGAYGRGMASMRSRGSPNVRGVRGVRGRRGCMQGSMYGSMQGSMQGSLTGNEGMKMRHPRMRGRGRGTTGSMDGRNVAGTNPTRQDRPSCPKPDNYPRSNTTYIGYNKKLVQQRMYGATTAQPASGDGSGVASVPEKRRGVAEGVSRGVPGLTSLRRERGVHVAQPESVKGVVYMSVNKTSVQAERKDTECMKSSGKVDDAVDVCCPNDKVEHVCCDDDDKEMGKKEDFDVPHVDDKKATPKVRPSLSSTVQEQGDTPRSLINKRLSDIFPQKVAEAGRPVKPDKTGPMPENQSQSVAQNQTDQNENQSKVKDEATKAKTGECQAEQIEASPSSIKVNSELQETTEAKEETKLAQTNETKEATEAREDRETTGVIVASGTAESDIGLDRDRENKTNNLNDNDNKPLTTKPHTVDTVDLAKADAIAREQSEVTGQKGKSSPSSPSSASGWDNKGNKGDESSPLARGRLMTKGMTPDRSANRKKGIPRPRTGSQSGSRPKQVKPRSRPASASRVSSLTRTNSTNITTTTSDTTKKTLLTYFKSNTDIPASADSMTGARQDTEREGAGKGGGLGLREGGGGGEREREGREGREGKGGIEGGSMNERENVKPNVNKGVKGKSTKKDNNPAGPVLRPRK